jgi:hypothetical protein
LNPSLVINKRTGRVINEGKENKVFKKARPYCLSFSWPECTAIDLDICCTLVIKLTIFGTPQPGTMSAPSESSTPRTMRIPMSLRNKEEAEWKKVQEEEKKKLKEAEMIIQKVG